MVSLKYVAYVMRANNHGEGGILALMALALRTVKHGSVQAMAIMVMGVLGACLFYGDAVLTPAISVIFPAYNVEIYILYTFSFFFLHLFILPSSFTFCFSFSLISFIFFTFFVFILCFNLTHINSFVSLS